MKCFHFRPNCGITLRPRCSLLVFSVILVVLFFTAEIRQGQGNRHLSDRIGTILPPLLPSKTTGHIYSDIEEIHKAIAANTQSVVTNPIPRLIHITVPDKTNISEIVTSNINAWRTMNPLHSIIIYDDADVERFIVSHYPEFYPLYTTVPTIVEKTDIWRYLVIHQYGGLYADSDFLPTLPIDKWNRVIRKLSALQTPMHSKLIALIDFTNEAMFDIIPTIETINDFMAPTLLIAFEMEDIFSQWWLHAARGHPVFYQTVIRIREIVLNECKTGTSVGDAVIRTGPIPFSYAVHKWLRNAEVVDNVGTEKFGGSNVRCSKTTDQSGDVCMLGKEFYGGYAHFGQHQFYGSWKTEGRTKTAQKWAASMHEKWKAGKLFL